MNAIYRVGSRCSKKVIIKPEEVIKFGKMIEDYNPIHSDPKAAKAAGFDQCICYGMLVGSMFSGLIATEFPHSVYLSQKLRFVSPVFVGDELNVWAEILAFRKSKGLIAFRTVVEKPSKTSTSPIVVVDGSAVMMNKGVKFEGESEWTGDY